MLNAFWVVVVGMAIVFASLLVLMLVMAGLGRIFKPREEKQKR
ncbi:OadG family protein [Chloroflexota bacterium]